MLKYLAILIPVAMGLATPDLSRAETCGPGGDTVNPTDRTFSFSFSGGPYKCGRFVDGTWWVVDPGNGVTVTSMTPSYGSKRNGYQVNTNNRLEIPYSNPICSSTKGCNRQSLDGRIFGSIKREAWVEPNPLPRIYRAGDSILKVQSNPDDISSRNSAVLRSTVLTVLSVDPTSGCAKPFRPPHADAPKRIFCSDTINIDAKLPQLPDVASQITIAQALAAIGDGSAYHRCNGSNGGVCFPQKGISIASVYGSNISLDINKALNRSLQSGSAAQKRPLVNALIQRGIDIWGLVQSGIKYYSDGGVMAGRKGLVLYAGYMLDDSTILTGINDTGWQEDQFTYMGKTEALWGDYPQTVTCPNGNQTGRWADALRDGGCSVYGSHPASQNNPQPTPAAQRAAGQWSLGHYQRYTHAQGLGVLPVIRQLDLEGAWNHQPFFDYYDRLLTPPWNGACGGYCSAYLGAMAKAYSNPGVVTPPPAAAPPASPVLLED